MERGFEERCIYLYTYTREGEREALEKREKITLYISDGSRT